MKHEVVTPAKVDTREQLIVIGNGMAGCRAVEELLARDPARYRITIFGAEPLVNYNRIMPIVPVQAGPRSERMSPNRLEATTTSKRSGFITKCAVRISIWYLSQRMSG